MPLMGQRLGRTAAELWLLLGVYLWNFAKFCSVFVVPSGKCPSPDNLHHS